MALNFPNSPAIGDQYEYEPYIYEWDGIKWYNTTAGSGPTDDLRSDLAADTGAGMLGTVSSQTVQYVLDNHTHTPDEVGALPVGGTAVSTTKLATGRTIALTGDVTGTSAAFNGTANVSITSTFKNSGITAGTYKSVTTDAKGNITAGTNPTTLAGYGITDAVSTTGNAASASKWAAPITMTIGNSSQAIDGTADASWSLTVSGVQPNDATLNAIASVTTAANTAIYFTGVDVAASTPLTAFGRSLIDDADAAAARTTLGVAVPVHTHTIANVTNLQSELDSKLPDAGTAASTAKLATARTITLAGDITGSITFDGSANVSISAAVVDDSHAHVISNVDNLQPTLDGKLNLAGGTMTGQLTTRSAPSGNGIVGAAQGGAFAAMWSRTAPFRTIIVHGASSYAPSLISQYEYTGAYAGLYSIGHLTSGSANPGSFVIHHINQGSGESFNWQFSGSTGEFYGPQNGSFSDVYIRSDSRLKSNLKKLESPLYKIRQLTGYTYDKRLSFTSNETRREAGIIAQDLQKVLPEAVNTSDISEDQPLSISNSGLNALLIEAFKEFDNKYENRCAELESQISVLSRQIKKE